MSHLAPPQLNFVGQWAFMRGVYNVRAHGVEMGEDGMLITLPIGSSEVRINRLN